MLFLRHLDIGHRRSGGGRPASALQGGVHQASGFHAHLREFFRAHAELLLRLLLALQLYQDADQCCACRLVGGLLGKAPNIDVEYAADGEEALRLIDEFKPHLVLMDIMMPRMDGIECCRRIKANAATRDTKVVMVTTKSEYDKVKEAFAAGCDDYVTKPINRVELLSKLTELLKFVELRSLLSS